MEDYRLLGNEDQMNSSLIFITNLERTCKKICENPSESHLDDIQKVCLKNCIGKYYHANDILAEIFHIDRNPTSKS
ncbi:hypothetical protein SteCoe_20649 [Stentor coeruleus]|uniref:Mitochondrial import inner membrane translocase subunit n=1 Tax=Stentor coeruleus TaxID=5963 RepID=A0A1R2BRJ0_9CILI|nr:hypothetical protein SteCoe_20649 [Stentor coeruleus]